MKLATWNIGGGFISSDGEVIYDVEDITYFIKDLQKVAPDIICLQEAHVSQNNNHPLLIAEGLGFDYYRTASFSKSHVKKGEKLCISILSKYPITKSNITNIPNPGLSFEFNGKTVKAHNKGLLELQIDYNNTNLRVITGQLYPFRKFGKNLLDEKYNYIRQSIEDVILHGLCPTIFCGDMNFQDVHTMIPRIFDQGFFSSLNNVPTTPRNRAYAKILLSNHWEKATGNILKGKADHYLCTAETQLLYKSHKKLG